MKSLKTVFSPDAAAELEQIADYIARDSQQRARRFVTALIKVAKAVNKFPERGIQVFTEVEAGFTTRKIVHKGYAIFYEVAGKQIRILHVAAPGRDWTEFLR